MDTTIINNNHSSLEAMDSTLQLTLQSYNMAHPKRDIAVIINNNRDREGSEKDVKALQAVLNHLQFDVRLLSDKTTVTKLDYGASIATVDARPGVEEPVDVKIPMYADLLVMYSSYEAHSSIRCPNEGSWFIQSLCQVLGANIAKTELQALLSHVSYLVSIRSNQTIDPQGKVIKQIPMVTSMLTKAFYFVPK